ncbi:hypothetical protein B0T26DRAFT_776272 [Lasiosphaeria miniovina]|uniref:Uncharacterized protein n=1 Tax=Lasiosphaeria miniovina TaxID=1954250 RepID=A0AA40DXU8_9PEZI|nr:uncharacterized protein B0T26DRAFT_776272 [Lasiosphaeria miniovina]KAK0717637.1 hypothetical protein B0T26DRAFT_776272 [Lasiosphaeria miniovina]
MSVCHAVGIYKLIVAENKDDSVAISVYGHENADPAITSAYEAMGMKKPGPAASLPTSSATCPRPLLKRGFVPGSTTATEVHHRRAQTVHPLGRTATDIPGRSYHDKNFGHPPTGEAKMHTIYQSGYLAFAASWSSGPASGLFHDTGPEYRFRWAFRERLLSRRVLHFTEAELTWECLTDNNCECVCQLFSAAGNA